MGPKDLGHPLLSFQVISREQGWIWSSWDSNLRLYGIADSAGRGLAYYATLSPPYDFWLYFLLIQALGGSLRGQVIECLAPIWEVLALFLDPPQIWSLWAFEE